MSTKLTSFFGTDGIRSLFGPGENSITPHDYYLIGRGIADYLAKEYTFDSAPKELRLVMGTDTRASGVIIKQALYKGIEDSGHGITIDWQGIISTPGISFLTQIRKADMGIMISASHNPHTYNGLKFFNRNGEKLSFNQEAVLSEILIQTFHKHGPDFRFKQEEGVSCESYEDVLKIETKRHTHQNLYADFLVQTLPSAHSSPLEGLRIVLDCAHGALYAIAPRVFSKIGAHIVGTLGCQPNGANINQAVGSVYTQALEEKVQALQADVGFAFDGDGDRIIVIDREGNRHNGDQIMAFLAIHFKEKHMVGTTLSNMGLTLFCNENHIELKRSAVGDRHIGHMLKENGWNLGGEPCGHIIMRQFLPTGDGLLVALHLAHVLAAHKKNNHQNNACLPVFNAIPSISVNVPLDRINIDKVALDTYTFECNKKFSGQGRLVIRSSGTEPLMRILVESSCINHAKQIMHEVFMILDPAHALDDWIQKVTS